MSQVDPEDDWIFVLNREQLPEELQRRSTFTGRKLFDSDRAFAASRRQRPKI